MTMVADVLKKNRKKMRSHQKIKATVKLAYKRSPMRRLLRDVAEKYMVDLKHHPCYEIDSRSVNDKKQVDDFMLSSCA